MSHSHETIDPVARAAAGPSRDPHNSGIPPDAAHVDVTSLKHQYQGMKRSQETSDWVREEDIIVSQKRNETFPTE